MEHDWKRKTEFISCNTVLAFTGNAVFSVLYFVLPFLAGKIHGTLRPMMLAGIYLVAEMGFCIVYLQLLRRPVNQMMEAVKRASQDEYEAQNLRSQAEIYALQSQINPHFLYNTLDTIRSHALLCDARDIAAMTESLSTLFRYSISRPGEMATLKEELDNVKNYLLIQQYRFPDKVEYLVEGTEDEAILNYQMPILTIQPIVENAIHHGLEMKIGKGHIKLRAIRTEDRITLLVSDNGLGMSEERLEQLRRNLEGTREGQEMFSGEERRKGAGIALANVDRRLKFYYGRQYGLRIRSTLGVGTMVEINLPFEAGKQNEKRNRQG